MSILTNEAVIGIAKQTGIGVPNLTPDFFFKYLEGAFATEMDMNPLRESGDDELIGITNKNMHRDKFSFKSLARPLIVNFLFGWLLGGEGVAGGSDPFTHTLTRIANGRKFLTIRRKVTTNQVQVLQDAKIEKITIEGEAGKEIMITAEGNALTSTISGSEDTPTFETGNPFMFYDAKDGFTLDGAITKCIKAFNIGVIVASQEGLQGDEITIKDLQDLKLDIEISMDLFSEDFDNFKKANYNDTNSISEDLFDSNMIFDFKFTETIADDRQLKIEIPKFIWNPVVLPINADPAVSEETIAGIANRPDSGEIITVTVKNSRGIAV